MNGTDRADGRTYPVHSRGRLTPDAVRAVRFRKAARPWPGLRTKDVRHFVVQVADDMASLYRELAEVYAENHRLKSALRTWQSEQSRAPAQGTHRRLR